MMLQGSTAAAPVSGLADAELLIRARSDPEAFAVFYRRYSVEIFRFFATRTACAETAADLTAETFAQAFIARRRYRRQRAPAKAWLYAIARHQFAHYVRSAAVASRARRRLGVPLEDGDDALERVQDLVDLDVWIEPIRQGLASLSDAVAEAVRFRVIDELPYSDVASRIGCSPQAARQRVARGLAQIANSLEGVE